MIDEHKFTTSLTAEVKDSIITIKTMIDGMLGKHWEDVIDTKNKMVVNGLRSLGWATPDEKKELLGAVKEYIADMEYRIKRDEKRQGRILPPAADQEMLYKLKFLVEKIEGTQS